MNTRTVLAGLLVFVVALALRLGYVEQQHRVLDLDVSRLTQTDNHVFAAWARLIADGDLLCSEQPHAYHHWTKLVAPEGRWLEWYGGATTYHQSPLYPYMIASVYKLFGDERLFVARAQALLSSLTCLLTFLLGLRLLGLRGGLIAGLLLALTGGYVFYDAFLLRDGPMAFFVALLALGLEHAVRKRTVASWFVAGSCLGLFTLVKETGPPLALLTLIGLAWVNRRAPSTLALHGGALLLGVGLFVAPAVLRNVEVGAPPFKLSTRGPEVLVAGNARGQDGVGWDPPSETLRDILTESNFSLPRSMLLTLQTHRTEPLGYLRLLAHKTSALFNAYEVPNNVNYYLFRAHLPVLELGVVGWGFLTPAAILGLLLGFTRRRRLAVPYLLFGALTASIVALYILARFRLQLLPLMALFAALAVDWCWSAWRARRHAPLALALIAFAIAAAWAAPSEGQRDPYTEKNKNTSVMLQLAKVGNIEKAFGFYQAQLAVLAPEDRVEGAEKLASVDEAFEAFQQAQASPSGSAQRDLHLARGYTALVPITKRGELEDFTTLARNHYQSALRAQPDIAGAHHGLARLEMLLATHAMRGAQVISFGPALSQLLAELKLHPEHPEAHRDLGLIYVNRAPNADAWRIALDHFLRAQASGLIDGEVDAQIALISRWPEFSNEPALTVLGESVAFHDPERAVRHAELALERAPENPRALKAVSDVFYLEDRFTEAIVLLERIVTMQPWRATELGARIEGFRHRAASQPGTSGAQQDTSADAEGDTADTDAEAEADTEADTADTDSATDPAEAAEESETP
ncbi:MAG: hypothetical protein DHS20C15_00090 [Planctomycetota bacterium]|nr:MAG: hypothetical protein DHS20C15_00090 [Planctomycetota bacterium]